MRSLREKRETIVYPDCTECNRLWRELSSAAMTYVRIYETVKGVAGKRRQGLEQARQQLRLAAESRRKARRAVKHHETDRHWKRALQRPEINPRVELHQAG
jgi:hypothetical protein